MAIDQRSDDEGRGLRSHIREDLKIIIFALLILTGFAVYAMYGWISTLGEDKAIVLMGIPTISGNSVSLNVKNFGSTPVSFINASLFVDEREFRATCLSTKSVDGGSAVLLVITLNANPPVSSGYNYHGTLLTDRGTCNFTARCP